VKGTAIPRPAAPVRDRTSFAGSGVALRSVEPGEWRRVASVLRDHNYRHCPAYSDAMARRAGADAEHVCVELDGRPAGLASLRLKRIPGLGAGIAYVSGGPLVRTAGDPLPGDLLEAVLGELVRQYVHGRRLVLRVAPPIGDAAWNAEQERRFVSVGFETTDQVPGYRTIVVDLARSLDDVRASFAKKWRYYLGRAEKSELTVEQGTDPALYAEFVPLFDDFKARKGFAVDLDADFYAGLQAELPEAERMHVAIARMDGRPVAGVVASLLGDTGVYLLGASNEAGRETNAPYLLQWRVIQAAAAGGLRWYDLGGIDPEGNPGVYHFKARMGGSELSAPGPYEIAPGGARGGLVRTAERLFRAARAARK
jgi:Acetyltransferase (GNAT) domain